MAHRSLASFQGLGRSAVANHIAKAVASQAEYHYTLAALSPSAVLTWTKAYFKNSFGFRHKFLTYTKSSGVYQILPETKICIAGDWGSGTKEASIVANQMLAQQPDWTLHLGDIYYIGDTIDVQENCLGYAPAGSNLTPNTWPLGSKGSFALDGNHEMYANGNGYYEEFLPTLGLRTPTEIFGQEASFFCLENDYWQVIGLDTAYNSVGKPILNLIFRPDCSLRKEQVDWLKTVISPTKGIILLSHHQYYSNFEPEYFAAAKQLASLINRPVLWFWGHEHRFAIYDQYQAPGAIAANGRCIGHGGMPVDITVQSNGKRPLIFNDKRKYNSGEAITVGYNGFATLSFLGNQLIVNYLDLTSAIIASETWTVSAGTLTRVSLWSLA